MKGQILDFSMQSGGLITGEDGNRYEFTGTECKEQGIPTRGMMVDFALDDNGKAISVYKALNARNTGHTTTSLHQSSNINGSQLSLPNLFIDTLAKRYATFSGRASKREFWGFVLFQNIAIFVLLVIGGVLGDEGALAGLASLGTIIPFWAVSARRLHDIGKSGWFILVSIIPLIGVIWLIILWCQNGMPEDNQYGNVPE